MQSYLSEDFQDIYFCPSREDRTTIIPDQYNFRTEHKECAGEVINQGYCSSAYAITASSVLSDRICLVTGKRVAVSPQYVIACENATNENCTKGYVHQAITFYGDSRILAEECMPYTFGESVDCNPKCQKVVGSGNRITGVCGLNTMESIKREILLNGPVSASIVVYDDFLTYKSGIYDPDYRTYVYAGSHTVKVIGWGEENNIKYWIIENSWGSDWGENGYAKILIDGENDLGISRIILAPSISGEKGDKNKDAEPETS